jgi:hypothetical protein
MYFSILRSDNGQYWTSDRQLLAGMNPVFAWGKAPDQQYTCK